MMRRPSGAVEKPRFESLPCFDFLSFFCPAGGGFDAEMRKILSTQINSRILVQLTHDFTEGVGISEINDRIFSFMNVRVRILNLRFWILFVFAIRVIAVSQNVFDSKK